MYVLLTKNTFPVITVFQDENTSSDNETQLFFSLVVNCFPIDKHMSKNPNWLDLTSKRRHLI